MRLFSSVIFTAVLAFSGQPTSAETLADATPPTITTILTPTPNANGWNNTVVTVSYSCQDAESGIDTAYNSPPYINGCPNDDTATAAGLTSFVGRHTRDLAYNYAFVDPAPNIRIDTTPPTLTATLNPVPNAKGWNNTSVTVSYSCSDSLSQIDTTYSAGTYLQGCPPPDSATAEGLTSFVGRHTRDRAGNYTFLSPAPNVRIDTTAPQVAVTGVTNGASYLLGQVPTSACDTTDALAGVATNATLVLTGGNPDGSGSFTATCSGAADNADNLGAAVSVSYSVVVPQADLVLTALTATANKGSTVLTATVANTGLATAQNVVVRFLDAATVVGESTPVTTLASGSSTGVSITVKLSKGTHTLTAVVDPKNTVAESNEGNNQLQRTITLK